MLERKELALTTDFIECCRGFKHKNSKFSIKYEISCGFSKEQSSVQVYPALKS